MCGPCKRTTQSKPDLRDRLGNPAKERWYNNIVLNIPHASVGGLGISRWDDIEGLQLEVRRWTDWYTDLLFIPDKRDGIQIVTFYRQQIRALRVLHQASRGKSNI